MPDRARLVGHGVSLDDDDVVVVDPAVADHGVAPSHVRRLRLALAHLDQVPEPGEQLLPEGRVDPGVHEEVDGRVDDHGKQAYQCRYHDPQGQSIAFVVHVVPEYLDGEDLVGVEDDPGEVADQEQDDDKEEDQGLSVLLVLVGVAGVVVRGHGHCSSVFDGSVTKISSTIKIKNKI